MKFIPINNIIAFGSDNGLAPTSRQVIIWTNDGYFTDMHVSLGFNELTEIWRVYP